MQYPLPERIGDPELFVGREAEFCREHGVGTAEKIEYYQEE